MTGDVSAELLGSFGLFADLNRPQLQAISHTFDEESFPVGQRILRQGFGGSGFYVIVDGEAAVLIDGEETGRLARGDFFGEISILLDEPPSADIVAATDLTCLTLARDQLVEWLTTNPAVTVRMLRAQAMRLRAASRWRD